MFLCYIYNGKYCWGFYRTGVGMYGCPPRATQIHGNAWNTVTIQITFAETLILCDLPSLEPSHIAQNTIASPSHIAQNTIRVPSTAVTVPKCSDFRRVSYTCLKNLTKAMLTVQSKYHSAVPDLYDKEKVAASLGANGEAS